ncbi:hypothetical protein Tco_0422886 [Tanacetum coccineum]
MSRDVITVGSTMRIPLLYREVIAQVSLAGTAPNAPPTLKDPKFWTTKEKKRYRRCYQHAWFSKYGEQDRKAAILYEKDYRELNYKFLNLSTTRMETIWTLMRQTKYLMDYYNCALVQHFEATNTQVDVNDAWE